MGQDQTSIGLSSDISQEKTKKTHGLIEDFVLDKITFNNVFGKDIRRVFIYKKAERLAKAIHLIAPAFTHYMSLKDRLCLIAVSIIDAAVLPRGEAKDLFTRELLALSSILAIARTSGIISQMNADLIAREAHLLLHETVLYEDPRLLLEDTPSLSTIAERAGFQGQISAYKRQKTHKKEAQYKGHIKDTTDTTLKDRKESILSVLKEKGRARIKDISTMVRGVSEKTIQRELVTLIGAGIVSKEGERRWSTYFLANVGENS